MNFKSIFMSMFAIAALASCSNDDDEIPGGTQGEKAYSWVGVSVSLPASAFSRAADANDTNAEALETDIKKISLYYQKLDGSGAVDVLAADLAPTTDFEYDAAKKLWTAKKVVKVPVEAGSAVDVYAAANAPTTPGIMPNWFNLLGTPANPNINYWTASSDLLSDGNNGFTMTGTTNATTLAKEADVTADKHVQIQLVRTVAKVLVTASKNGIDPENSFAENNPNGVSGNFEGKSLKWIIGNNNKKLFLLTNTVGGEVHDPNWAKLTADATGLDDEYANRAPGSADYQMAVPGYNVDIVTGYESGTYVQYCNENTNEDYQYGNTSFISVKAVFVPTKIVTSVTGTVVGNDLKMIPEANTQTNKTFYYNTHQLVYLTADAYKEATETAGVPKAEFKGPYNDGECYYFVPIKNAANEIGVTRNTYYTMRIKSLKAPGEATPNPGEIEDPVEQSSWIAVDFEVAKWNPADMGDLDLE